MPRTDTPLSTELLDVAEFLNDLLLERLGAAGWPFLTRNQALVLTHVAQSETTPAELARMVNVSRQSMQKILERLEEVDATTLLPHPTDQRSKLVTLTTVGVEFAGAALRILDGFERRLQAAFGTETVWNLRRVLQTDWVSLLETVEDQNASGR